MQSNDELVKNEVASHYSRSLLVIGILVISFSLSFILRMQPAEYGFELNEFDPFFNYRATEFVVENGLPAYFEWNDDLSWHPIGRDVSATSQVMLHTTTAMLYQTFGTGSTLYDFVVWFPVVIGSLTSIVVFALVRTIGGTTAGLFAALFFSIAPIIILRGSIGWFKSEPLGLFYGLLAVYLLLSGIKSDRGKVSLAKIIGAGAFLAFGVASWGGIQFFILPIGLFFLALPFLRKDNKYVICTCIVFTTVFLLITISFERTGFTFISSLNGFFLIGCTAFLIIANLIKKITDKNSLRKISILLGGAIITGVVVVSSGLVNLPAFRYLNAANPFLIAQDMLTDSVSEHATATLELNFFFFSILMVFAGIGAWFLFQKKINHSFKIKNDLAVFALLIGLLGVYFSSAFVRLEVFGTISVVILASIGLSILISKIQTHKHKQTSIAVTTSFCTIILVLLVVPTFYPIDGLNWSSNNVGVPISILHGGSHFNISTNDWPDSMQWVKENTDEDAVIAAWWDYGYWISTLGERKTLVDNSTLLDYQIKKVALMYVSTPENAWRILTADSKTDVSENFPIFPIEGSSATNGEERQLELFVEWQIEDKNLNGILNKDEVDSWWKVPSTGKDVDGPPGGTGPVQKYKYDPGTIDQYPNLFEYWKTEVATYYPLLTGLDADYVLVNLAAKKLPADNIMELYTLNQNGGDETKLFWFAKIAGVPIKNYYNPPGLTTYTDSFWDDTLLGKLIPFTLLIYVDPENPERQSETPAPGYVGVYVKNIKFPSDGDGQFQLVYSPPSFDREDGGPIVGPFIYKINKDYN